jgi:hypothetical protein
MIREAKEMLKIVADKYDAGLGVGSPIVFLWAADQMEANAARKALRAVNRKRERMGLPLAYAEFGAAYF